ncbi:reverse transcriptase domain-containing protein [Tanacetum coccineum]|uniref:Reverse transcriptase domain-containing protein n=1 Tax=Tanacetum coccineum TaxID=301880 RepID=A0ABQ5DQY1_9ASTR
MTHKLADRSISRPIGVAKDVFIKVGKFHFPADFVVVNFDADPQLPLILGRSFLKTGRALIDVYAGELTLRVGNKAVTFNLDQTLTYSSNYDDISVNRIDVIEVSCEEYSQEVLGFSETDTFLAIEDEPISPEIDDSYYDSEGDILLLEKFLNDDPSSPPLPPHELKVGTNKLPVIIAKDLKDEEKATLIKEVLKLLDAGLIYPISDSPWVSPVHCVPKKGGFTVVENEENELIPTRLVTGWRVCIDYQKLNDATRKDHFPLPFMDQMLERLAGNEYYCFLDGFSGYFQIPIDPQDQEKTTFTCPYGTFAYRRMPFGLCNAPGTFQRCMMAIFHDMIEKTMEVFMDDFSVFGNSFGTCLSHLDKMLKRCEDTNLCLNWEKSHFMVKEGIVLGHKISKNGIEVDKAKVDVIAKLPHPTTVKGIRSFLGHAGFYRRFIQDFSKIARPMTRLLEKDTPFFFSKECIEAFQTLKKKLTEAPILVAPDWDLPFELMCDASDFAIDSALLTLDILVSVSNIVEFGLFNDDEASNHEDASDTGAAPKQQQQVIQNGNSKKRISTGKDGVIRILPSVTAAEIQAIEKERKAKNILLMAIPKEHMRRFHGMDDAKEIWEAIRTRFGGNAKIQRKREAVFKQQFEAFTISSSEGLELKDMTGFNNYFTVRKLIVLKVSTEDANHKFLRSLPPAWSNLVMTMRTKPDVDTLSIDDLYNNLMVFEQEIQGASKTFSSAQNDLLLKTWKDDDLNIKEMDINWQIAMIAIRMKKFYKKT